ncbi:MAG TPA: TolC family protein [Geobacter sp.]|nr:TolC family protein [Geobacter sp.]
MRKVIVLLAVISLAAASVARAEQLTLRECLDKAAATSNTLKAASHEVKIAEEQIGIAATGLRPRIDLQGGYVAQLRAQAVKFGAIEQETQDARFPYANVALYDTLYDFGRTGARQGIAKLQRDASLYSYSATEQDIFLQVVRAYFGIMAAQKLLAAADDEVIQMVSHQKTAQALFDQGVVTRNDLLQAEVRVAASRQNQYSMLNEQQNGWLVLNYLTGAPADYRGELKPEFEPVPLVNPKATPDLSKRGEVAALRAVVAAGDLAVKEVKSNYYPEIFAKLGVDYLDNSRVREQAIWAATLGFKVNLFDSGATTARVRQAVQARFRDEERLRDLEERVRLEFSMAQNDMKVAQARIKVAEKAIAQGMENLRITKDRYQEQVGTATEVIDAQTLLTQTRTEYYRSILDLQVAAARVKRATGEL